MTKKIEVVVPGALNRPKWLEETEKRLGRPIRVLNLGNIANNGFQNAKVMRRAGIDADCVAYDYYHVMGTAEWEDAEYRGNIGDQFYPDWWRVRLKDYSRPDWFIQGPKDLCIQYVRSRYDEKYPGRSKRQTEFLWQKLNFETQIHCFKYSNTNKFSINPIKWPSWLLRKILFGKYFLGTLFRSPQLRNEWLRSRTEKYWPFFRAVGTLVVFPFLIVFLFLNIVWEKINRALMFISRNSSLEYVELKKARRTILVRGLRERIYPLTSVVAGAGANTFRSVTGKRFGEVFGEGRADAITQFIGVRSKSKDRIVTNMSIEEIQKRRAERKARRLQMRAGNMEEQSKEELEEKIEDIYQDEGQLESLYNAYLYFLELAYPDHGWILDHYNRFEDLNPDALRMDIEIAKALSIEWKGVFELYDVVLAYSTDGILPMASSDVPFFTYEHGTLRSIPFEDNAIGRLCASSYRSCEQIMVTNLDNLNKPEKLGMNKNQVVCLPHAVDDQKLLGFQSSNINDCLPDKNTVTFLCPARQDWGDDDPSFMKGNDKLFRATKIISDEGYKPKLILFEWGRHVEKSKALIAKLGIEALVTWVKPMKKVNLWKNYFKCHAIVDQFSIPAFGGVTFEGLTFSKRIITSIDLEQSALFFGEVPPVLNASTPESIADAMRIVLDDPDDKAGIGIASGDWARKYHSSQRILDLQLDVFKPVIQSVGRNQGDPIARKSFSHSRNKAS